MGAGHSWDGSTLEGGIQRMKHYITYMLGVIGAGIAAAFGGWEEVT